MPLWLILALLVALTVVAAAYWWRTHPSACPYGQRFWVQAPHPFITRKRLKGILEPKSGDQVLEVGPGTGFYTLDMAGWVGEDGTVQIFDLQQEMLDHTMKRAQARGLDNLKATRGDAQELPFKDDSFDAAVLTAVLGEIPDQGAALREIKRVLKLGGRLIVGELFGDPHMVRLGALRRRGEAAGLRFERRSGPLFGYFARLVA